MPDYDVLLHPIIQVAEHDYLKESNLQNNWFIFYTAPRAEKFVCQELMKRKYEVFLPMTKTLKVWKNRQKKNCGSSTFPELYFCEYV